MELGMCIKNLFSTRSCCYVDTHAFILMKHKSVTNRKFMYPP